MSDRPPESLPGAPADEERLLSRVRAVLTPLPPVDQRHVAQILAAVRERRRTPWQRAVARWDGLLEAWRVAGSPWMRGATLAAAALVVVVVVRGVDRRPATTGPRSTAAAETVAAASRAPAAVPLQRVDATADAAGRRVPTQFLLDARAVPTAAQVSLVGDFNDWNVTATPLTLENGVWTGTWPLTPGRHVYAFVVNGTTWLADPRAPRAADADFGRPGSIIIVSAP